MTRRHVPTMSFMRSPRLRGCRGRLLAASRESQRVWPRTQQRIDRRPRIGSCVLSPACGGETERRKPQARRKRRPLPPPPPPPGRVRGIAAFGTELCLARDEVSYAGQTIALVVADSRYVAEDAAALVVVDYEVLPAISDCRDALKPGAAPVHADLASNLAASIPMSYGDVDSAFAGATHVFEEESWLHRGGGMSLETRAVLAGYEPAGDLLTVWSSTQTPHLGRRPPADLPAANPETIRGCAPDLGGGF